MMMVSAKLNITCCMNLNCQFKMICMLVYCHILIYLKVLMQNKDISIFFKSNYLEIFKYSQLRKDLNIQ